MPGRKAPVYTPRWFYRFFAFLEGLPIPVWILGLSIILIGGLAMHLDAWRQGLVPVGEFNSYLAIAIIPTVSYPTLWIFLDRRARLALNDFFKNRGTGPSEFETKLADFISLSPRTANLAFLVGLLYSYFSFPIEIKNQPLLGLVLPIWGRINYHLVGGLAVMLLYRILRQAFLIPRLFREISVDIFNPNPVYALSRYASQGSIAWLLLNYITLLTTTPPDSLFTPANVMNQMLIVGSSLIFFFAPLANVNQIMRKEKELLLARIGEDQKIINSRLHTLANTKNFAGLAELRNAVSALKEQREVLQKLQTWPWQADTLRNLLTPLTLPILVYLMQRYFGTLFGF